jgi:hypothetical protein
MPSLPAAPTPTGHSTAVVDPILDPQIGLSLLR